MTVLGVVQHRCQTLQLDLRYDLWVGVAEPGLLPQQGVDDKGEKEGDDGSNAVGNLASNDALIEPSAIGKVVEYHEALENDENPSQRQ